MLASPEIRPSRPSGAARSTSLAGRSSSSREACRLFGAKAASAARRPAPISALNPLRRRFSPASSRRAGSAKRKLSPSARPSASRSSAVRSPSPSARRPVASRVSGSIHCPSARRLTARSLARPSPATVRPSRVSASRLRPLPLSSKRPGPPVAGSSASSVSARLAAWSGAEVSSIFRLAFSMVAARRADWRPPVPVSSSSASPFPPPDSPASARTPPRSRMAARSLPVTGPPSRRAVSAPVTLPSGALACRDERRRSSSSRDSSVTALRGPSGLLASASTRAATVGTRLVVR